MPAQWSNPLPVMFSDNFVGGSEQELNRQRAEGGLRSQVGNNNVGTASSGLASVGATGGSTGGLLRGTDEATAYQSGLNMLNNRGFERFDRQFTDTAGQNTASLAEALSRSNIAAANRAQLNQAASARGGNQAAAIRGAQATGANNILQANQQLTALRAQEEQQRLARMLQAQQMTAALNMQNRDANDRTALSLQNLGLGTAVQRGGLANQQGGLQVGALTGLGQLGLGTQNLYVGSNLQRDLAQMAQEQEDQNQRAAFVGGLIQGGAKAVGSMFGG